MSSDSSLVSSPAQGVISLPPTPPLTRTLASTSDETPTPPPDGLTRDPDFWLDDGNVVLVAGGVSFRLYKGLLAAQSTVFANMFAVFNAQAGESLDGCPVVRLSDSPEDLRHLLRVLMPKMQRRVYIPLEPEKKPYTFGQLSALVRLGHKYRVDDVQQQALACVQTSFTNDFDVWESDDPSLFDMDASCLSAIGAVQLARLTDNPKMLPVAFYECTLLGGDIVGGWTREDGTVDHLAPEDLRRVINGYGTLRRESCFFWRRIFGPGPHPRCIRQDKCGRTMQSIHVQRLSDEDPWYLHDELSPIRAHDLCEECGSHLKNRYEEERRKLWIRLPSIFNLPEEGLEWETDTNAEPAQASLSFPSLLALLLSEFFSWAELRAPYLFGTARRPCLTKTRRRSPTNVAATPASPPL